MKTLSANVTTGKAGDSRPAYLITIEPNSGDSWNALHWATEDITDLEVHASTADGISTGTTQFDSAGATFTAETNKVLPGDTLDITGDTTYTVASVTSATRLVATGNITVGNPLTYTIHRDYSGGRIKQNGLGTILKEVDLRDGGNISTVSGFTFEILDQDNYSNSADFPAVY